jgi:Acetyltransferase (GNAT) family.
MPNEIAGLRIEQFDPSRHERAAFSCGVSRLDNFLRLSAKKQQKDDMTRVYVVVEDGESRILGYHAINLGMMNVDLLESGPKYARSRRITRLFVGQVAVSEQIQGRGVGSILLTHAFAKAVAIANQAGCFAVVLDVLSDGGEEAFQKRKNWYTSFGFQEFPSSPARMFMTMKQVRLLLDA